MNYYLNFSHYKTVVSFFGLLVMFMCTSSYPEDLSNATGNEPAGVLSLGDAAALALERNPTLAAFSFDIRAAEARKLQTGYRPNPELDFEIEDLRWHSSDDGDSTGLSGSEMTVEISQLFELGGKRSKRSESGTLEVALASWDYKTARVDILAGVAQNFIDVLVAQKTISLAQETISLTQSVRDTIAARVAAGQVSPLELNRADIAVSTSKIEHERSSRELLSARVRLSSLWGSSNPQFERVIGDLSTVRPIPSLADLKRRTSTNPDMARWMTEIAYRESVVDVERSNRIPDLDVSTGYRISGIQEARDQSAVVGFSLPLPLFNRNRGSIQEAKYMLSRANRLSHAVKINLLSRMTEAYYDVSIAYFEIQSLANDVLPQALTTFNSINEAYRQGKLGYLDVLEAQRTLFVFRIQHLEALGNYHRGISTIDRLIGESLFQEIAFTVEKPEEN